MKKLLIGIIVASIMLVGCGEKEYKPTSLGEFGVVYSSHERDNLNMYASLNVESIENVDGKIHINVLGPTSSQVKYCFENKIEFKLISKDNKEEIVSGSTIKTEGLNDELSAVIVIDANYDDYVYLEIEPFTQSDNSVLVFEL